MTNATSLTQTQLIGAGELGLDTLRLSRTYQKLGRNDDSAKMRAQAIEFLKRVDHTNAESQADAALDAADSVAKEGYRQKKKRSN